MFKRVAIAFLICAAPLCAQAVPWDVSQELTERVGDQRVSFDLLTYAVEAESLLVRVKVKVEEDGSLISDEVVELRHWLPRTNHLIDYTQWGWGSAEYQHTPLCVAHARFARQLEDHIQQVVNV